MTPIPTGWKPISSAPKDGTPVLLFARHIDAEASTRVVGWFNADYGWIAQSYIGQPFARLIPSQWAELLPLPGSPASVAPGDAQDEQPKRNGCGSVSFKLSDGSTVSCDWSSNEWELSIPAKRQDRDIAFKELLQDLVMDNLKARAEEMRDREKRSRTAYQQEYMGAPMRWLADVYDEAAAVFEAKLAALAAQQQGEA